ncbi:peptide chain release factor H [Salinispora tropica]|uniref:Class I peptide chain release factor n=1 Tax=Salinispora tropica (strain ATCC BAA-916 / DSM 44818 / JCM 13857 / NBRC 105044 / CNB-440) TaxID=369723 RepID=A4X6J2_SALTO|nr:peptide chain release factor H [Salinispora tropica]ABP54492.1 Class I peptide chain release factor [Salinispora tropica CNB-440]
MNLHLLLSAGRGPQECAWALARLLSRLEADAVRNDVDVVRLDSVVGDRPGTYRSVLVRLTGTGVEAFAARWTGTLCWQAPSPYRTGHGRKNWYVAARQCEVDVPVTPFTEADVEVLAVRTGGPGGQHRNKASTAVRATHRPTGTVVVVDTERQLSLNRSIALRLLRQRITAGDEAARRALVAIRRRAHDEVVRGGPTRTERP